MAVAPHASQARRALPLAAVVLPESSRAANSARPKEFPTIETYERHLVKRIIPRWGDLAPLAIKSTEVEKWFLELRTGNAQKKVKPFADPTVDKIRRIMHLVYKHGQRHEFLPRQQEGNPMNWVSQRTTSDYTAIPMTPKQAFEVLLNIPEPRRTLTLSDAATALCEGCAFDDLKSQLRRFSLEGVDLLLAVLGLVHFRPLVDVSHLARLPRTSLYPAFERVRSSRGFGIGPLEDPLSDEALARQIPNVFVKCFSTAVIRRFRKVFGANDSKFPKLS